MSFILDALKKVEREKRGSGARGFNMVALSSVDGGGRRQVATMVVIALASAGVTAWALTVLPSKLGGDTSTLHETSSVAEENADLAREPSVVTSTPVAPSARSAEDVSLPASEHGAAALEPEAESRPVPSPTHRPPPSAQAADSVSAAVAVEPPPSSEIERPSVDDGASHPVSIVGREHAALAQLKLAEDGRADDSSDTLVPDSEIDDAPPVDSPELVLQGTSVLDGRAVAVINGQRVFEGDLIEGALVVAIHERDVELERDGRRFRLRL